MKLSVVIVSYKVRHYLEQCLNSVKVAIDGLEAEVIVVDNHSQDGSVEYLSQHFPWVRFIRSHHNLGFARGNNLAIRQSRGEYVLLLNPDTIVAEDTLHRCVGFMDDHPRAGGAGVRMLRTDGSDALESRRGVPTPMTALYKMLGLCSRFPRHRVLGKYYMGYLPWDSAAQIEIMSGAFCMLRRKAIDEVGMLDEDFFMYGEDIDLSYRLLRGGWENWYLPLKILHYKGESTQKSSFRYVHVFYGAMLIFLKKHYGNLSYWLALPIRIGIYGKAALALMSMMAERVKRSLGFVDRRNQRDSTHYVFDVATDHVADCKRLAGENGLTASFVSAAGCLPDDLVADHATKVYYVYDLSTYTFGQMLEHLSSMADNHVRIAVYHPEHRSILTESEFIQ